MEEFLEAARELAVAGKKMMEPVVEKTAETIEEMKGPAALMAVEAKDAVMSTISKMFR